MSLPRYPEYKDSGIGWLGPIPRHWQVRRLKFLFDLMRRPVRDDDEIVTAFRDGQVTLRTKRRRDGFTNALQEIGYQGVRDGDLVIHAMDAFAGAIGVSDSDGKSTPVYSVCSPRGDVADSHYYAHLLRHMALGGFINSLAKGIRERSTDFRWSDAGPLFLPLPPLLEQRSIIAFLDRETAKIDALIAEQEKLLTLLAEKRQATISHAVTRGLDPDVPMKDSGVAWLGEVPAHWEVVPFKYCVHFQEGPGIMADDFRDEGVPLLRVSGVRTHWATLEGCNYLDPEKVQARWSHFKVEEGDLLISASASMGTVCEVGPEAAGSVPYTGIIRLKAIDGMMVKNFVRHVVVSGLFLTQIDLLKAGATIQHFGPTHLSQMDVARPPEREQQEIAACLDAALADLAELQREAGAAIELLLERRSALIAAAVTGQIDVRGFVETQAA